MREIEIVDQTLHDAHQSLWASRMTTAMMLPIAERMDQIGFKAIDLGGAVHFDVGVRYLKENPWEKTRLMRQKITCTPMIGMIRSRGGIGFGVVPNDIALLWIERLVANGLKIFRVFDPLLDNDNNIYQFKYAKDLGTPRTTHLHAPGYDSKRSLRRRACRTSTATTDVPRQTAAAAVGAHDVQPFAQLQLERI